MPLIAAAIVLNIVQPHSRRRRLRQLKNNVAPHQQEERLLQ
jgi:hypothetical protein